MDIAICSLFRDSTYKNLARYFNQLEGITNHDITLYLGEGDSTDDTLEQLHKECKVLPYNFKYSIIDVSHGGANYGSIVHPTRFLQAAYCGNRVLSQVKPCDVVLWLESDLIWDRHTFDSLVSQVGVNNMIAPMVYLKRDGFPDDYFYDTFAFRIDYKNFAQTPNYHPRLRAGGLMRMTSVGSMVAWPYYLGRDLYFPAKDVFVGLCGQFNGSIFCDTRLSVYHP